MVKGRLASVLDSGMDFLLGEAKFVGPRTVEVTLNCGGTRILRGADVVVNLGTEPFLPDIGGLAESRVQVSATLLRLERMPRSIVVLGGGYVGCEFAELLNTPGAEAIAAVQMAILAGMEFTALRGAIIAHRTIAEGLNLLFTPAWLEA